MSEPAEQCPPLLSQKIKANGAEEEDKQDVNHRHNHLLCVLGSVELVQHPYRHIRAFR